MTEQLTCTCKQLCIEYKDLPPIRTAASILHKDESVCTDYRYLHNKHVIRTEGEAVCRTDRKVGLNRYLCTECHTEVFCVLHSDDEIIGINHSVNHSLAA